MSDQVITTAELRRDKPLNSTSTERPLRVLLVQHCAHLTGSTISGRIAADGFRKAGWDVHCIFSFQGPAIADFERLGCTTDVLPHKNWLRGGGVLRSGRGLFAEYRNSRAFDSVIQSFQPDVVYVNSLVSLAAILASRRAAVPSVWHVRELFDDVGGEMKVPAFGGKRLVRFMLSRPDLRVALSRSVVENVFDNAPPSPTIIVPNAVDDLFLEFPESQTTCRRLLELPANGCLIGVPGTLRPAKGLPFYFEAVARVAAQRPHTVFAVTGDGQPSYVEQLRKQVREAGLEDRVHFTGMIRNMPAFYRACDIICAPSRSESFGRTVIESFAIGTPVVATAVGGMRETITHEHTGLMVDYGDVSGFARALVRLVDDASLREKLSAAAGEEAASKYTAAAYQSRLCDAVRQVAGARR